MFYVINLVSGIESIGDQFIVSFLRCLKITCITFIPITLYRVDPGELKQNTGTSITFENII